MQYTKSLTIWSTLVLFEKWLNKLEERITESSERDVRPNVFSLEGLLVLLSYGYGLGVRFRLWLYSQGILKQKTLPCFVISIGNIALGGAGKTPMAMYLAQVLKNMGKHPVVISRGYKGKYRGDALIVSDGDRIFSDAENSGDEPYMMAKRRSFPVVVGKDRFRAGKKAMAAFNPDVMILDDGFQHLKLKRDLDLLLLDYSNPLGNKRYLPAGRLRETPQDSAQRADALVFTRSPENDDNIEGINKVLQYYPGCPWFKTFHVPFIVTRAGNGPGTGKSITGLSGLRGKRAILFSGIAKNSSFYRSMEKLGVNVVEHLEFKDHYRYREPDVLRIKRAAERGGADVLLTTEKDWAKIDPDIHWGVNVIVIGIQIEFEDSQKFESLLISRFKKQ